MRISEIANAWAKRFCADKRHEGASPCPTCAELRVLLLEAFDEVLHEIHLEIRRNLG